MTTAIEIPLAEAVPSRISELKWRLLRSPAFLLSAITLVGAVLRFSFLDRPPIWGDEAMTYMRVSGTYRQLLGALQDWGFAPLHYELYWVMRQLTELTPFMMRLPTAIAGTLMIPGMYWLAVQLTDSKKIALVAALFTATSAYLCNYSRDAKMYIDFWFFCTLNFACLLWWLRVRTRIAWWSWVASGVAMMGLNLLGGMILAIELIALLFYPARQWKPLVPRGLITKDLFLLGVIIMALGPLGYYLYFNRYADRIEKGGLQAGGLGWVEAYNKGRTGRDLVLFTTTAYLYGWEWPRQRDQDAVNPRALRWLKIAGATLLGLLTVGAFPWPRTWTGIPPPPDPPAHRVLPRWWRSMLVLVAWIAIPTYAVYAMSLRHHLSPPELFAHLILREPCPRIVWPIAGEAKRAEKWSAAVDQFTAQFRFDNLRRPTLWPFDWREYAKTIVGAAVIGAALWFCADTWRRRAGVVLALALIALVMLVSATVVFYGIGRFYEFDGSVWMPRYLGVVYPAVAIVVATLLLRLPTRPLRWSAIAILVGINLIVFGARVFASSEPPTAMMARDLLDSQPADAGARMYYGIPSLHLGAPGTGMLTSVPGAYYLTILSGRPTNPQEMIGAFHNPRFGNFKRWSSMLPMHVYVPGDVSRNPHLQTIIVWEKFDRGKLTDADPIAEKLGPGWRRIEERLFPVRDHWMWRNLMTVRRRVYERIGPPTTLPATTQATTQGS